MHASSLTLYFTSGLNPELIETIFCCNSENILKARRGYTGPAQYGSFSWTPAVRAASVFFLRAAASARVDSLSETELVEPLLEGGLGSLALSLDYAISKQSNWLLDMFGLSVDGTPMIRYMVHRTNSELKRPGPVLLSLNRARLSPQKICVHLGNDLLSDAGSINALANSIQEINDSRPRGKAARTRVPSVKLIDPLNNSSATDYGSSISTLFMPDVSVQIQKRVDAYLAEQRAESTPLGLFHYDITRNALRDILFAEASDVLTRSETFSELRLTKRLERLASNATVRRLAGNQSLRVAEVDLKLTGLSKVGVFREPHESERLLKDCKPIVCFATPAHIGALAIFNYLKLIKGYNLQLNIAFALCTRIHHHVYAPSRGKEPEVFLAALAQAAVIVGDKKSSYLPFMFVPSTTYAISTPKNSIRRPANAKTNRYIYFGDEVSTSQLYLSDLRNAQSMRSSGADKGNFEPFEIASELASGDEDLRAVLWCPYYQLNERFNNCSTLQTSDDNLRMKDVLLFGHKEFLAQTDLACAFNVAVRDGWLSLLENRGLLRLMIDLTLENHTFLRTVSRTCGLWNNLAAINQSLTTGDAPA